jgi:hypothetical protein
MQAQAFTVPVPTCIIQESSRVAATSGQEVKIMSTGVREFLR